MTSRGFTLIETVVVVALTSLIMGVLGSLLIYFYRTNAHVFQQVQATLEARRGIEDAVRLVREASYDPAGSYPVLTAATSTLSFSSDLDNDDVLEPITYTLTSGVLSRTATLSGTGQSTTIIVSSAVANSTTTPIFRYFDSAGVELTDPVDRADIATIRVTLVIEADINRGPSAFTLSGNATLRNSRL